MLKNYQRLFTSDDELLRLADKCEVFPIEDGADGMAYFVAKSPARSTISYSYEYLKINGREYFIYQQLKEGITYSNLVAKFFLEYEILADDYIESQLVHHNIKVLDDRQQKLVWFTAE